MGYTQILSFEENQTEAIPEITAIISRISKGLMIKI
jgi:hypothetical protein